MLFGITGGIGSGKTFVARCFEKNGFPVYFTDVRAKELIATDEAVRARIVKLLGAQAFRDGIYQTQFVAQKVFSEPHLLRELDAIVHPAVVADLSAWSARHAICFVESALLYESGINVLCSKVIAVVSSKHVRLYRALRRDYRTWIERLRHLPQMLQRMNSQMSTRELVKRADFVIENSFNDTENEIFLYIQEFLRTFAR